MRIKSTMKMDKIINFYYIFFLFFHLLWIDLVYFKSYFAPCTQVNCWLSPPLLFICSQGFFFVFSLFFWPLIFSPFMAVCKLMRQILIIFKLALIYKITCARNAGFALSCHTILCVLRSNLNKLNSLHNLLKKKKKITDYIHLQNKRTLYFPAISLISILLLFQLSVCTSSFNRNADP